MIFSNKIKIGSFITSFFFLQNITIMADQPIDCENEDFKSEIPSYALTEEEKVQLLEMELINALDKFDECIENKNKSVVASSENSSSSASRSSYGEDSTSSIEEESSSNSGNSQTTQSNNVPSQSSQTQSSAGGSISEGDMESSDDDDIVARQLREAALAEKDPEIKELLWERYRDYKGINKK